MQKLTLLLLLFASTFTLNAQDIAELERRNGFKDLKLGIPLDSVKGEVKLRKELKEQGEFPSKLYSV